MKKQTNKIVISILCFLASFMQAAHNFRLLQYNIQQRPSNEGRRHQLTHIHSRRSRLSSIKLPKAIKKYNADVVTINEAFTKSLRPVLVKEFRKNGYPYHTNVANRSRKKAWSSGVMIFSKYPIIKTKNLEYTAPGTIRTNPDVMAAKGAQYIRIIKNGLPYNIFATHTNASYKFDQKRGVPLNDMGRKARKIQLKELKQFIDKQHISSHEPVIIAGDMNIEMRTEQKQSPKNNEYAYMLKTLNAFDPKKIGHPYTLDDRTNEWAKDGRGYLDYVLYSNEHRRPVRAIVRVVCLKTKGVTTCKKGKWRSYRDLSDHYPVIADFTF